MNVPHTVPMTSLDKAFAVPEIVQWCEYVARCDLATMLYIRDGGVAASLVQKPVTIAISPKVDGMAITLRYDGKGALVQAVSRGNGIAGMDMTVSAMRIPSVPHRIDVGPCEVRGEIYMPVGVEHSYASNRCAAAACMKRRDGRLCDKLGFAAWDVVGLPGEDWSGRIRLLHDLGFETVPVILACPKRRDLLRAIRTMETSRPMLPYDTDGLVFRVDDLAMYEAFGSNAHHPKGALALKLYDNHRLDDGNNAALEICNHNNQ